MHLPVQIYRRELERAVKEDHNNDSSTFVGAAYTAHLDTLDLIARNSKFKGELDTVFGSFLDHNLSRRFVAQHQPGLRESIWVIDVLAWDVYLRELFDEEYWGVPFEGFMHAQGIDYTNLILRVTPDYHDLLEEVYRKTENDRFKRWQVVIDGWRRAELKMLKTIRFTQR